ncbi:MAG: CAP domain-containing protein [Actinomycetota bacterium]
MRNRPMRAVVSTVVVSLTVLSAAPQALADEPGWLSHINEFRDDVQLEPVKEDPRLSRTARLHSIYMVETGFVEHGEKPGTKWTTEAGRQAGEQSNVAGGTGTTPTPQEAVNLWIEGPFHRLGLMRPAWRTTGFSLESGTRDGEDRWGATLNVIGGLTGSSAAQWPLVWPTARREVATSFLQVERVEWPDPAVGCPDSKGTDYGTIITASFGPGDRARIKSVRLRVSGGAPVPVCTHTSGTYKRDDYTDVGWRILAENNTVMVLPRVVLSPGTTYQGRITLTDGRMAPIRFTTAPS